MLFLKEIFYFRTMEGDFDHFLFGCKGDNPVLYTRICYNSLLFCLFYFFFLGGREGFSWISFFLRLVLIGDKRR